MGISYAREKFGTAVYNLATGTGDIRQRIFDAYLSFHTLKENDFPNDLKGEWLEIYRPLHSEKETVDANGTVTSGRVQNSLAKLSIDECAELAHKIHELNFKLHLD